MKKPHLRYRGQRCGACSFLWRSLPCSMTAGRSYSDYFLAIIISSGLEGVVDFFEIRINLPRSVSVILIFLVALVIFIAIVYTVIPFLLVEIGTILSGVNATSSGGWGILLNLGRHNRWDHSSEKCQRSSLPATHRPFSFFPGCLEVSASRWRCLRARSI